MLWLKIKVNTSVWWLYAHCTQFKRAYRYMYSSKFRQHFAFIAGKCCNNRLLNIEKNLRVIIFALFYKRGLTKESLLSLHDPLNTYWKKGQILRDRLRYSCKCSYQECLTFYISWLASWIDRFFNTLLNPYCTFCT